MHQSLKKKNKNKTKTKILLQFLFALYHLCKVQFILQHEKQKQKFFFNILHNIYQIYFQSLPLAARPPCPLPAKACQNSGVSLPSQTRPIGTSLSRP